MSVFHTLIDITYLEVNIHNSIIDRRGSWLNNYAGVFFVNNYAKFFMKERQRSVNPRTAENVVNHRWEQMKLQPVEQTGPMAVNAAHIHV